MRFFNCCTPTRPSDTGAILPEKIAFNEEKGITNDNLLRQQLTQFSIPSEESSFHKTSSHDSSNTAPNSPETCPDVADEDATASSTSSGLELFIDDEESASDQNDDGIRRRNELVRFVNKLQLELKAQDEEQSQRKSDSDGILSGEVSSFESRSLPTDTDDLRSTTMSSSLKSKLKSRQYDKCFGQEKKYKALSKSRKNKSILSWYHSDIKRADESNISDRPIVTRKSREREVPRAPSIQFALKSRTRCSVISEFDCDGDEFQAAYELWYAKGLLNWKPTSKMYHSCSQLNILDQSSSTKFVGGSLEDDFAATCRSISPTLPQEPSSPLVHNFAVIRKNDEISRSNTFRITRIVPIVTCFGNGNVTKACSRLNTSQMQSTASSITTESGPSSPSVAKYKSYLFAYKERIAARKVKCSRSP
jgi:hypothetical protein